MILLEGKVASYGESVTRSASIGTAKVFEIKLDGAQSRPHLQVYCTKIENNAQDFSGS